MTMDSLILYQGRNQGIPESAAFIRVRGNAQVTFGPGCGHVPQAIFLRLFVEQLF